MNKQNFISFYKFFSFIFLELFYFILKLFLEVKIKIINYKFFCTNLYGSTLDRIIINCDGSLTCNCRDITGNGQLGNILTKKSLIKIMNGEKINIFRDKLNKGILPIKRCALCKSLKIIKNDKEKLKHAYKHRKIISIKELTIENTINCSYNCLGCMKNVIEKKRLKRYLTLDDLMVIINIFKKYKINKIWLYNLGEPSQYKYFKEELKLVRFSFLKSYIFLSTNGMYINNDKIRNAIVKYTDGIEFSIDGIDQKLSSIYQIGIDYKKVVSNLIKLIDCRGNKINPKIYWKYVLFLWNDKIKYLNKLKNLAEEIKVDGVLLYPAKTPIFTFPLNFILFKKKYTNKYNLKPFMKGEILMPININ